MEVFASVCYLCEVKTIHPFTEPHCEFNSKKICTGCIDKLSTSLISITNKPPQIIPSIPESAIIVLGQWELCKTHYKKLRLLCQKCEIPICVLCVPSHNSHYFASISDLLEKVVPQMHNIDYLAKVAEKDKQNNSESLQLIQENICDLFAKVQEQPPYQALKKCEGKIEKLTNDLQELVFNYANKELSEVAREIKHPREAYKRIDSHIHWVQWNSQTINVCDVKDFRNFKITLPDGFKIPHFSKSIQISPESILACGGRDTPSSNGLKKAMLVKINPVRVEYLEDMKSGRANHCLAYFNRFVYVIGGCDHDNRYTNRAERLCLSSFTWEDIASCNEIRDSTSAVGVERENAVYVFGGRVANLTVCRSIEKYLVSANVWVSVPLKTTFDSMVLGSILISPTQVLVFGGQTGQANPLRNANLINLQEMTVEETSFMQSDGGCIVNEPILLDNKIFSYVFKGSESRRIEICDLSDKSWKVIN